MNFRLTAISAVVAFASSAAFAAPAWNSTTIYTGGEVVTYQGKDYKAKWWTQNNVPGAEQWGPWELVSGSATAAPTTAPTSVPTAAPTNAPTLAPTTAPSTAPGACVDAAWSSSTAYTGGQKVSYNGRSYQAQWWTSGDQPDLNTGSGKPWKDLGACSGGTATAAPTATPVVTAAPTATPVVTAAPTATPVVTATPKPTATPTATPVVTATPTATPVVTAAPTATPVVTATPAPTVTPTVPPSTGAKQIGTYFAEWSIYGRKFYLKNVQDSGQAAKLTFLNYSFGNVYKQADGTYQCQANVNKAETGNQDGGDAWALYQKGFAANESVDGVADAYGWPTWDDPRNGVSGPLKGNWNQLKKLKAKNPNLKVLISLGGWTWSKWFSAAASTDALRKTLVSSCIDVWIKGNLPFDSGSNAGGPGVGAGVFDGIDIDWEYPGVQGIGTNTVSASDKENYTLLMKEFRAQLDAIGAQNNKRYLLTVAIGAGDEKIAATVPGEYSKYLDWINIMSYDFNGAWDAQGPTDFQSALYADPASPRYKDPKTGKITSYYTDAAVKDLIARGVPAAKLHIGVPFYGRGWTGVTNVNNGLYQAATGGAAGTYEKGIEDYKVLKNAPGTEYIHPVTKQTYKFDGSTFWSYDTPRDIKLKADYAKSMGMGGIFSWEADGDTATGELVDAMTHINK
ncbi:glycosyl hydrolase family 18 protein [Chitinibacter tainanensis]|uniref:glycosyl hydrolase family 18 protein n=1 Tax=Chitinibacter tainanensis TaxID=230667 RepID=UPI000405141E|nr:glycosyl hydrolase family 18 protein [Chitinibacter tainanensis]